MGILEPVLNPLERLPGRVYYYIPHQPVFKSTSSTTKMRIVFDASSGHPSLNACLFRGRVYAGQEDKQIAIILMRTRLVDNLMGMDLEKAFLQVGLHEEDRDCCRILWPRDPFVDNRPQVYRFTRVTFGLVTSPFLLGATVEHHLKNSECPWAEKLIRGSYVDNYIVPIETPDQIPQAVKEIRECFFTAGFNCSSFSVIAGPPFFCIALKFR